MVLTPRFCSKLRPCQAVFLEKFDTSDTFMRILDARQKKFDANIKPSGVYIVSPDRLSRSLIHPSPASRIGTPKDGRMPDDRVTREVFWNISLIGEVAFYALVVLSLALFGYGVSRHLKKVLEGKANSAVMEDDSS